MSKILSIRYETAGISDPTTVSVLAPYQTVLETFSIDNVATAANGFGRYDFNIPAGQSCALYSPYIPNGAAVYLYNSSQTVQTNSGNTISPGLLATMPVPTGYTPGSPPPRSTPLLVSAAPGQVVQTSGAWNVAAQGGSDTDRTVIQIQCVVNNGGAVSYQDVNAAATALTGTIFWVY